MILKEWRKKYEKEAEQYIRDPRAQTYFEEDKGFMDYIVEGNTLTIDHSCTTDILYMRKKIFEIARSLACRYLITYTMRSPSAYVRKTGAHFDYAGSRFLANGKWYWRFEEDLNDII